MAIKQDKVIEVFGYTVDNPNGTVRRELLSVRSSTKDYGCDPIGGDPFMFRMVPSGDIVDKAECDRRLKR